MTLTAQDSAFFASPISDNLSKTPEGYLICHGCKIARTGVQDYLGEELGKDELYGKLVKVHRLAEDVSDPLTIASAEAKPITDDHPAQGVDINTHAQHAKGEVHNARFEDGHIVADLVVKDPILVSKIENKTKRELSCGYNYTLEKTKDGKYFQANIRINHVAVVEKGRAGKQVRINDSLPVKNRRKPLNKKQAIAKMYAAFAKDATPEEAEAMMEFVLDSEAEKPAKKASVMDKVMAFLAKDDEPEDKPKDKADDDEPDDDKKKADDQIAALTATVDRLSATIDKMAKDADSDEDKPKDKADDDEPEDEDKKEAKAEDKALKPILAKLDVKDRAVVLEAIGVKRGGSDTTAKIVKAVQTHAAKDASAEDKADIGKKWAAAHNPHCAKK